MVVVVAGLVGAMGGTAGEGEVVKMVEGTAVDGAVGGASGELPAAFTST